MNGAIRAIAIVSAIVASGCGTTTLRSEHQSIGIATGVYLELPSTAELAESFDAVQAIVGEYEEGSYSFAAHIEARPGTITIVGIGALGGPLFTISYDGNELVAIGAQDAQIVNAEYVLADVLLTHWDVDWIDEHLQGASISTAGHARERYITRDGDLIIGITYDTSDPWGGVAQLTNIERQYSLQITTAEYTPR
jgi:hypothetical protein